MNRSFARLGSITIVLVAICNLLSCMHDLKLVAIAVQPPGFTFPTPDPNVQGVFTALGSYIHPPDTRDITDKVTWKTDIPQLLQINGGVVSPQPGGVCGIANVSASMKDKENLVIGYATVTVNDPTNSLCPGGNQTKGTLTVGLTGNGSVTSVPGGIDCPAGACGAQFNVGDTVVLTATPDSGATFGQWGGCPSVNVTTCTVVIPTGAINVTATFN